MAHEIVETLETLIFRKFQVFLFWIMTNNYNLIKEIRTVKREFSFVLYFGLERNRNNIKEDYDFTNGRRKAYEKRLKKQITINLGSDTVDFFQAQSEESVISYQIPINLYLSDYAKYKKQLQMSGK